MSMETGDLRALTPDTQRPLPPEIKFNSTAGTFSGTATPGLSVRLTSSVNQQMRTAEADADGNWKITIGQPRWYTIFKIWTCDPATGKSSETIKFTFGGSSPKLDEAYASETVAFGRTGAGTEISVFGPAGQVLGRCFAFGKLGVWAVKFHERINAGDKVCIVAKLPNGNTSMPLFVAATAFSVDDRNVAHIAGSGAALGDRIRLFDAASGEQIAETAATDSGSWSVSFCNALEAGKRIAIQRLHENGTTTRGPVFTATKYDCPVPVIETFAGSQLGGMGEPGLKVGYAQIRDHVEIRSGTVTVDETALWNTSDGPDNTPFDFQPGDILVARSQSTDGTAESVVSSNVTIGDTRPGSPFIESIDQNSASGWAEPHTFVLASTADKGVICAGRTTWEGHWYLDWSSHVGSLPTTTVVTFEVFESLMPTTDASTSLSSARYADAAAAYPAQPTIDLYTGEQFAGGETVISPATWVRVTAGGSVLNPGGAKTDPTQRWSLDLSATPGLIPDDSTPAYAQAWFKSGTTLTLAGPQSTTVTVDSYTPPAPDVTTSYTNDIKGYEPVSLADQTQIPNITIYICDAADLTRTPVANSGHLTSRQWEITPAPPRTPGENMLAWAQTDAGAKSSYTPFTIAAASKPIPPEITIDQVADVSGSGTYQTTVELSKDGTVVGTTTVPASLAWTINVGSTPTPGTKFKAVAIDSSSNRSDPFYAIVGDTPTTLTIDPANVTTTSVTGTVTDPNQRLQGWRLSDGLKVMDTLLNSTSFTANYISTVTVVSGDIIEFTAQDTRTDATEGTMTHYDGKQVN
ncbi:Ig-like domain-containing protein [Martelella sp. FOR1707]